MTLAGGLSAKISTRRHTRARPTASDEQIARRTCRDYDALQRVTTGTGARESDFCIRKGNWSDALWSGT